MLNELYTFAEPVQVVPFSSLKWGKFTLLHTPHITTVMRGQIMFLARLATSCSARKQIELELQ